MNIQDNIKRVQDEIDRLMDEATGAKEEVVAEIEKSITYLMLERDKYVKMLDDAKGYADDLVVDSKSFFAEHKWVVIAVGGALVLVGIGLLLI